MYFVFMYFFVYVDKKDKMVYLDLYNGQLLGLKEYKKVFI